MSVSEKLKPSPLRNQIQASLPAFVRSEFEAQREAAGFNHYGGESQLVADLIYAASRDEDFKKKYELWLEMKGRTPGRGKLG